MLDNIYFVGFVIIIAAVILLQLKHDDLHEFEGGETDKKFRPQSSANTDSQNNPND